MDGCTRNKENAAIVDGTSHLINKHSTDHPVTSKANSHIHTTATKRKRALAELSHSNCLSDSAMLDRAKQAIKRGCTEMGIRRYASLSSMSAKHASLPSTLLPQTKSHKRSCTELQNPSSDATVVLFSDDTADTTPRVSASIPTHASVLPALESQATVVPSSSPMLQQLFLPCDDAAKSHSDEPQTDRGDSVAAGFDCELREDVYPMYVDLWQWMRKIEKRHCVRLAGGIPRHADLSSRMRPILVDWLMEVSADYRMHRQTLHLTVQYLDRFLASTTKQVGPSMLQCYGTACLSLAMKVEEQRVPTLSELTDFSKDAFTRDQLRTAEVDVLVALDWHLSVPTLFDFLCIGFQRAAILFPDWIGRRADEGPATGAGFWPKTCPATVPRMFPSDKFIAACDCADALLHCQEALEFSASELAAACFYVATSPSSLDGESFYRCTGYTFSEVWPAVKHLKALRAALYSDLVAMSTYSLCSKQCCRTAHRYASKLKYIRLDEMWVFQPHHQHLLAEFEEYYAAPQPDKQRTAP